MHNNDRQTALSYNVNNSAIRNADGTQMSQSKNEKGGTVSGSAIKNSGT